MKVFAAIIKDPEMRSFLVVSVGPKLDGMCPHKRKPGHFLEVPSN